MAQAALSKQRRRLRLFSGIVPIDHSRVSVDVIAGVTLAALAIPEVMGYTKIAGMPVITGLYTIVLPIIAFALIGSSRHLVVGADSASAAIMFAGLVGLAQPYSPQWVALAGWLALLVAGFLLLSSLLKLGFLADFMSRTVLIGFLTGVGIQVACGQIAGMFGVSKTGHGPVLQAYHAIKDLPHASGATIIVSAGVLIVILGARIINKKIPGPLIAVVGAIACSAWLGLSAKGVSILGSVPSGLPSLMVPTLPHAGQWSALIAIAASLFLVILAQSAATSRAYAVKYDDEGFSEDKDLVGLSLANISAGLTGTFPVNGSPTKTQMVDSAGGRSQISQLTTAVIVVIVLLFLTKPLSYMPNAVLASVVFLIGVELINVKGMVSVYKSRRIEFWVALITVATVVVVGVEQGIILAIVLSLIVHIRHSYRPRSVLMSFNRGAAKSHSLIDNIQAAPGLVIYLFGANLYYANSQTFQTDILKLIELAKPKIKWLAIDAISIDDIDYTSAEVIRKMIVVLDEHKIQLVIINVNDHVKNELKASKLYDQIGEQCMYQNIKDVIAAYKKATKKK